VISNESADLADIVTIVFESLNVDKRPKRRAVLTNERRKFVSFVAYDRIKIRRYYIVFGEYAAATRTVQPKTDTVY